MEPGIGDYGSYPSVLSGYYGGCMESGIGAYGSYPSVVSGYGGCMEPGIGDYGSYPNAVSGYGGCMSPIPPQQMAPSETLGMNGSLQLPTDVIMPMPEGYLERRASLEPRPSSLERRPSSLERRASSPARIITPYSGVTALTSKTDQDDTIVGISAPSMQRSPSLGSSARVLSPQQPTGRRSSISLSNGVVRDVTPPRMMLTPRLREATPVVAPRDVTPLRSTILTPRRASAARDGIGGGGLTAAALAATFQGVQQQPSVTTVVQQPTTYSSRWQPPAQVGVTVPSIPYATPFVSSGATFATQPAPQPVLEVLPPATNYSQVGLARTPSSSSYIPPMSSSPRSLPGVIFGQQPMLEVLPPVVSTACMPPVGLARTLSYRGASSSYIPPVPRSPRSLTGSYVSPQIPTVTPGIVSTTAYPALSPSCSFLETSMNCSVLQTPKTPPRPSMVVQPPMAGQILHLPAGQLVSQAPPQPLTVATPPTPAPNMQMRVPTQQSSQVLPPPTLATDRDKLNLTAGLPNIDSVEKQKDAYNERLDNKLKCEEELLKMRQQQDKVLIYQAAEAKKRHACLQIDQEAKQRELALDQHANKQRMGMHQELQSWKMLLNQQAAKAILDYQAKKSQEELIRAKIDAQQAATPRNSGKQALELKVGDRIRPLPGKSFAASGIEYYKEHDAGTVTKVYDDDKGVPRISITWDRTGQTSNVAKEIWHERFRLEEKGESPTEPN